MRAIVGSRSTRSGFRNSSSFLLLLFLSYFHSVQFGNLNSKRAINNVVYFQWFTLWNKTRHSKINTEYVFWWIIRWKLRSERFVPVLHFAATIFTTFALPYGAIYALFLIVPHMTTIIAPPSGTSSEVNWTNEDSFRWKVLSFQICRYGHSFIPGSNWKTFCWPYQNE